MSLLNELKADTPKMLQYNRIADESLHGHQNSHRLDRTFKNLL